MLCYRMWVSQAWQVLRWTPGLAFVNYWTGLPMRKYWWCYLSATPRTTPLCRTWNGSHSNTSWFMSDKSQNTSWFMSDRSQNTSWFMSDRSQDTWFMSDRSQNKVWLMSDRSQNTIMVYVWQITEHIMVYAWLLDNWEPCSPSDGRPIVIEVLWAY